MRTAKETRRFLVARILELAVVAIHEGILRHKVPPGEETSAWRLEPPPFWLKILDDLQGLPHYGIRLFQTAGPTTIQGHAILGTWGRCHHDVKVSGRVHRPVVPRHDIDAVGWIPLGVRVHGFYLEPVALKDSCSTLSTAEQIQGSRGILCRNGMDRHWLAVEGLAAILVYAGDPYAAAIHYTQEPMTTRADIESTFS